MLVAGEVGESTDFPITLVQFSTQGTWHNHTPLIGRKKVGDRDVPFFRFYFDGLVAHIHPDEDDYGDMTVGKSDRLGVLTMPYENSFQDENLRIGITETNMIWTREIMGLANNQ